MLARSRTLGLGRPLHFMPLRRWVWAAFGGALLLFIAWLEIGSFAPDEPPVPADTSFRNHEAAGCWTLTEGGPGASAHDPGPERFRLEPVPPYGDSLGNRPNNGELLGSVRPSGPWIILWVPYAEPSTIYLRWHTGTGGSFTKASVQGDVLRGWVWYSNDLIGLRLRRPRTWSRIDCT